MSDRARRLQLKVSPRGTVELVVPRRCSARVAERFLEQRRPWLEQVLARHQAAAEANPELHSKRPERVRLQALDEEWQVEYRTDAGPAEPIDTRVLWLSGGDAEHTRRQLLDWLRRRARAALVPWLDQVSRDTGLEYQGVTIRAQKTRWGSCSSRGRINLNQALLFLPAHAVAYLLVHELCHTRHLHHGPAFWKLVEQHAPEYRQAEAVLREARSFVPAWAYPGD